LLRDFFNQEVSMKKGIVGLMILGLIVTTSVTGFLLANDGEDIIISKAKAGQYTVEAENGEEKTTEKLVQEKEEAADEIKVYVVGEVNKPGVVTLKKGQIIQDAIELAGGPTEDADIENINLAYELRENVMIRVMSKSETTGQDIGEEGDMQVAAGNTEIKVRLQEAIQPRIVSRRMFPAEQAKTVQAQMMQKAIREKAPTMGVFQE